MSPSSCISGCGGKDDVQVPLPFSIPGPTRWVIRLFPVRPLVPVAAAVGRSSNASPRACSTSPSMCTLRYAAASVPGLARLGPMLCGVVWCGVVCGGVLPAAIYLAQPARLVGPPAQRGILSCIPSPPLHRRPTPGKLGPRALPCHAALACVRACMHACLPQFVRLRPQSSSSSSSMSIRKHHQPSPAQPRTWWNHGMHHN
jgi:hypothetical protein